MTAPPRSLRRVGPVRVVGAAAGPEPACSPPRWLGRQRVWAAGPVGHRLPGRIPGRPALHRGPGALEPGRDLGDRHVMVHHQAGHLQPCAGSQSSVSVAPVCEANLDQFHSTAEGPPRASHSDQNVALPLPTSRISTARCRAAPSACLPRAPPAALILTGPDARPASATGNRDQPLMRGAHTPDSAGAMAVAVRVA